MECFTTERLLVLLGFANDRERIDGPDNFGGKIIDIFSLLLLAGIQDLHRQ